jgi:hypothetical protein
VDGSGSGSCSVEPSVTVLIIHVMFFSEVTVLQEMKVYLFLMLVFHCINFK